MSLLWRVEGDILNGQMLGEALIDEGEVVMVERIAIPDTKERFHITTKNGRIIDVPDTENNRKIWEMLVALEKKQKAVLAAEASAIAEREKQRESGSPV